PVGLCRDNASDTACVEHLGPYRVLFDQSADWNQARRSANQSVVWLARTYLPRRRSPDIEPYRGIKTKNLMNKGVGELVLKDLDVVLRGEIAVLAAGIAVRAHDPVDELLQAPFPLRSSNRAPEVLGGHDVGRVDGPDVGELYAVLLEIDRAITPVRH